MYHRYLSLSTDKEKAPLRGLPIKRKYLIFKGYAPGEP